MRAASIPHVAPRALTTRPQSEFRAQMTRRLPPPAGADRGDPRGLASNLPAGRWSRRGIVAILQRRSGLQHRWTG